MLQAILEAMLQAVLKAMGRFNLEVAVEDRAVEDRAVEDRVADAVALEDAEDRAADAVAKWFI